MSDSVNDNVRVLGSGVTIQHVFYISVHVSELHKKYARSQGNILRLV